MLERLEIMNDLAVDVVALQGSMENDEGLRCDCPVVLIAAQTSQDEVKGGKRLDLFQLLTVQAF